MTKIVSIALLLMAGLIVGCSSGKQTVQQQPTDSNRERALQHFLEGSLFDQKGDYARALIEYQEALRYQKDPAIYHAMAKDYSLLEKHALAIQNGGEAVRLEPGNRTYRETLADIYISALDLDNAIKEYQAIVRIDSGYRVAWLSLARLLQIRQPVQAIDVYHRYMDRFGPDQDAYFQLAQIHSARNEIGKAAEALKGLLSLDPSNFEIKKALGDTYLRADSIDAALRIYDELAELHPEKLELRAAIAHAHLVKQNYDEAALQFDMILTGDSLSVEDQLRFGQVFVSFVQKDSAVAPFAITLFEKVRDTYPDDWRPYWFLGALAAVVKNDSAAMANYERVRDLASWNPDGWVGIASVYFDQNRLDEAIEVLTEAKTHVPDEFRVHFLLGIAYHRKKHLTDAASALERAVTLSEKGVDAMSALALVYDEMKRHEDSDSIYERALRIDPHNHLLLNNYAYSLAERALQLDRAMRMAKEAVSQQPLNQSYLDTYGWIYYQLGEYREAERYIKQAIELGTTSAVIHEHLGDIYFKLSDKDKAMEYWQKSLEIDDSNDVLREKIRRGSL